MMTTETRISSAFRRHGYKLTPQRRAVIAYITRSQEHLTPVEIHERIRREHPGIGLVTVYRTLEILAQLHLICETHAGGACRSYLARNDNEHHHHLICSGCGRVVDFKDCELEELAGRLTRKTGFAISGHLLEFIGVCRKCGKTRTARGGDVLPGDCRKTEIQGLI